MGAFCNVKVYHEFAVYRFVHHWFHDIVRTSMGRWYMSAPYGQSVTIDEQTARMYLRGEASPVPCLMQHDD